MRPGDIPSDSVNFPCGYHLLPSTFRAAERSSMNFHQHSVWSEAFYQLQSTFHATVETFIHLPSTFHTTRRSSVKCCQVSVQLGDFQSTYVNFLCNHETFRRIPSTFRAAGGPSVNYRQPSVPSRDLPLTFENFLCGQETFRQLSVRREDFLLTSANSPYNSGTFCDLPSTSHAARRPSVNFHQLSKLPGELRELSVQPGGFLSTFRATGRSSINRQPSVWPRELLSTSINFQCAQKNFRQLSVRPGDFSSSFRVAMRLSVNFRQLSLRPEDLLPTFVIFTCC